MLEFKYTNENGDFSLNSEFTFEWNRKLDTDFLEDTSKRYSSIEIMFAMTPCMRLYSWIGKSLYEEDFDNRTYISKIGIYDENHNLIAVAKLHLAIAFASQLFDHREIHVRHRANWGRSNLV